ncbi:hypothetical protein HKX48_004562 [Thoreauomyces humboldtii]|nr:hypothetical protein HKX48_004562 [Thoreauomyces humboldtii]
MKEIEPHLSRGVKLGGCQNLADIVTAAKERDPSSILEDEPALALRAFPSPFQFDPGQTADASRKDCLYLRGASRYAWVRTGPNEVVLELPSPDRSTQYLIIYQREDHLFEIVRRARKKFGSRYFWTRYVLATQDTLAWAIRSADTWVATRKLSRRGHLNWNSPWRSGAPSDWQCNALDKMHVIRSDTLTKGEAADILTRMMRGSQARKRQEAAVKARVKREKEEKSRVALQFDGAKVLGKLA